MSVRNICGAHVYKSITISVMRHLAEILFMSLLVTATNHSLMNFGEKSQYSENHVCASLTNLDTKNLVESDLSWPIFDQGHCGDCWAYSTTTMLSIRARQQHSMPDTVFSPGFVAMYFTDWGMQNPVQQQTPFGGCNGGYISYIPDVLTVTSVPLKLSTCSTEANCQAPRWCNTESGITTTSTIQSKWSFYQIDPGSGNPCHPQGQCVESSPLLTREELFSAKNCDADSQYLDFGDFEIKQMTTKFFIGGPTTQCSNSVNCVYQTIPNCNLPLCADLMTEVLHTHGALVVAVAARVWNYLESEDGDLTALCQENSISVQENNLDHAVTIVGDRKNPNNLNERQWIVQNSWGNEWGDNGYTYITKGCNYCGIESMFVAITESEMAGTKFTPNVAQKYKNAFETTPQRPPVWHSPTPAPANPVQVQDSSSKSWIAKNYVYVIIGGIVLICGIILATIRLRRKKGSNQPAATKNLKLAVPEDGRLIL